MAAVTVVIDAMPSAKVAGAVIRIRDNRMAFIVIVFCVEPVVGTFLSFCRTCGPATGYRGASFDVGVDG